MQEVGDVHPQRVGDQQKIRELWVSLSVLIPLDGPALHAGEVRQLLL